jgi:hypothetical protein
LLTSNETDTQPNVGIAVPGILAKGEVNGEEVNLLPYFNGELASSNRGGMAGVSINFLDGGGAAPLMENKASNNPDSRQEYVLPINIICILSIIASVRIMD